MGESSVAVIVGSSFDRAPAGLDLAGREVATTRGPQLLHEAALPGGRRGHVLFRHGLPHALLPHQIDYRRQALALREVGCGALLVTSSVGVLDPAVPLGVPLPVGDILFPDNRLPDGSPCTHFLEPSEEQGHLVLEEGLLSPTLANQVAGWLAGAPTPVVFAYAGGPRTKTPAENRMWAALGAQVNSMTLAPEVVLAAELGIPCAALVLGHKYSHPDIETPDAGGVRESLLEARDALEEIVVRFLLEATPVPAGNHLYRFRDHR